MRDHERLKKVIDWLISQKIAENQKAIASILGYKSHTTFSAMVNGRLPIPQKVWFNLSSMDHRLNREWLNTGIGEMLNEGSSSSPDECKYCHEKDLLIIKLQSELLRIKDDLIRLKDEKNLSNNIEKNTILKGHILDEVFKEYFKKTIITSSLFSYTIIRQLQKNEDIQKIFDSYYFDVVMKMDSYPDLKIDMESGDVHLTTPEDNFFTSPAYKKLKRELSDKITELYPAISKFKRKIK